MKSKEELYQEDLKRIQALRYMDDDFFTVCLADNIEGVQLILRIVLQNDNITVTSVKTQEHLKNLRGHMWGARARNGKPRASRGGVRQEKPAHDNPEL